MSKNKDKKKWVDFKEIKTKVSIESVLAHYGILDRFKKKGDSLVGPCPIHKGSNPTQFNISIPKNVWHCFGDCHKGGNVIDFVVEMEKIELREAALLLKEWFKIRTKRQDKEKAEKEAGVEKEVKVEEDPESVKVETGEEEKEAINKPLTFELKHLESEHPYLQDRGLNEETIKTFSLGYCKKGLMKGRVVIPIHNVKGELVAYAGRWPGYPAEDTERYKLPAGFHKSFEVFNLFRVDKELVKERGLILVEGFFDCFKVWQAGFKNVVALMGSDMSEEQEKLILEAIGSSGKVALMFDEDEAGWKCRENVLNRLVDKVYIKVIELGEKGLQPDMLEEEKIKRLFDDSIT